MRIVITKNGKVMIQEINPEIKYKNILSRSTMKNRNKSNQFKKNTNNSFDNKNITSFNSISTSNNNNNDVDTILSNLKDKNKDISNCQVIQLATPKKLNMPSLMAEKYMKEEKKKNKTTDNSFNNEKNNQNLLPDVFVSINKVIEDEAKDKGYDYVYNNINCLSNMQREKELQSYISKTARGNKSAQRNILKTELNSSNSKFTLPKILPAYPLKYIINRKSYKNIFLDAINQEKIIKKGKKVTEENFRTIVVPSPKHLLEKSLENEINSQNSNLIMYLNDKNNLSGSFVRRVSSYDNEQIGKLNKISQKAIYNNKQEDIIRDIIRKKISGEYVNSSESIKKELLNMRTNLDNYEKVMKIEEKKKVINKKERYFQQYRDAEKNWLKFNALRFYKKSSPPINSATGLLKYN